LQRQEEERRRDDEEEMERKAAILEQRHRRELMNSCPPSKVRTYACDSEGMRTIKYLSYEYDFDVKKCVEKERRKRTRCRGEQLGQVAESVRGDYSSLKKDRHGKLDASDLGDVLGQKAEEFSQIDDKSNTDSEIKKLSQHIGLIEGKVS
jgi:hypothetical protein